MVIKTPAGYTKSEDYSILLDNEPPNLIVETKVPCFTNQSTTILEGSINDAETLSINSTPVSFVNSQFNKAISLSEGENSITIKAVDNAGNIAEKNYTVIKDSKAPDLIDSKVEKLGNGEYLVSVKVSDSSGLKKTAIAKLEIDGRNEDVILLLNSSKSEYSKIIYSSDSETNINLKTIKVEDYLENSKEYYIQ